MSLKDPPRRPTWPKYTVAPEPEDIEPGARLRDVVCPQCKKPFRLRWESESISENTYRPTTLSLRGCPSGGIYAVEIHCPHCNYEEEL